MASSLYKKSNSIHNHSSNKSEEAVKKFASMMIERITVLKNQDWEKSWFNGVAYEGLPQNYSGRTYNASNSFMLQLISATENYSMPVFMTFKQAMDNGLRINKGSESFPVVYWDINIKDSLGNRLTVAEYNNLPKADKEDCSVIPFLKYYPVFNIDQTNFKEVKPEEFEKLKQKFGRPEIKDSEGMYSHNAIDNMVQKQTWVCPIKNDKPSDDAYYSRIQDIVVLPMKAQFKKHESEEEIYKDGMRYYSVMLHEMTHSTGSPDRLAREKGNKFGDPKYAKEELVAELTSAMICNSMGFDSKITDNSAKYLDNWLGALKEDPKFIVSVMADVNKAAEMILDKVDEQRLALGETPYLSKNMVTVENGYSLEPEFKPAQELIASEPIHSYYGSLKPEEKEQLNHSLVEQYNRMKEKHPDAVLLFRVEDNYMILKEDTKIGKEILGLEISERNVPGIGILQYSEFKHSDLDKQLPKLPRAGVRVAICEQAFDPKLERPKISRGTSNEIPKEKSYKELSEREQQKKERELIKDFSKDNTIAIINSYQKKHESKERQFLEGELQVSHSLLFQGLISYHQFYAAASPKEYAKFCLSNDLEPDYASAKQLWRNNHESGQPNVYMFPSSGEILHQREQKVDKYNDHELKILAVKELCLNIKNPTPFLNDLEKKGLITEHERTKIDELLNQPIMAKTKKSDESVSEKKEKKVKEPKMQGGFKNEITQKQLEDLPIGSKIEVSQSGVEYKYEFIKSDKGWGDINNPDYAKLTPYNNAEMHRFVEEHSLADNTINIIKGSRHEEKNEETIKQPREPQMVTVNGDKVSHAHVFTKKDNPEQWLFIAKINDRFLPSVPISQQEADNFRVSKNVPEMMEKYYPTKVMPKISDEEFKAGQQIMRNEDVLKIDKFNVYKESNPERENFGKYMFYAKVEGQSMSVLAKQEDLNAYFDKVKTPAQLVENIFGEKLQLKSHYEKFKLPDGFDPKQVKLVKGKDTNDWFVYLDMGEAGKTKGKLISREDKEAYFGQKTATVAQLGAKYLFEEINTRMGMKQENKIAETQKMKI